MVYKKKYATKRRPVYSRGYGYKKKYKYGKRKARYSKYPQIAKFGSNGLPKAIYTKLNYTTHLALTSTSGAIGYYYFNLNSVYDPDHTGVGTQPYMRDTYATLYKRYAVSGAKIKMICSTDGNYDILLTARQIPDSAVALSDIELEIQRGAMKAIVSPGRGPRTFKNYYSVSKAYGVSKYRVMNDDVFTSAVGASPGRPLYLGLCYNTQDRTNTAVLHVEVQITYYVKFYNFVDQAAS